MRLKWLRKSRTSQLEGVFRVTRPAEPLTRASAPRDRACSPTAPTGIRNRALMVVMYGTGLRLGEALALRPADIDPVGGTVRVLHGKGDRARTLGLDDGALAVVQRWTDRRAALGIGRGTLFCTMFQRMRARAGLVKRCHPHGLRHTYAAQLCAEGTPVNVIQDALGHWSLATTNTYLRHIAPAEVIAVGRNRTTVTEDM